MEGGQPAPMQGTVCWKAGWLSQWGPAPHAPREDPPPPTAGSAHPRAGDTHCRTLRCGGSAWASLRAVGSPRALQPSLEEERG